MEIEQQFLTPQDHNMTFNIDTVRDGRYSVYTDQNVFISEHNEFHVAHEVAQNWSQSNSGKTAYIHPPKFRVSVVGTSEPNNEEPIVEVSSSSSSSSPIIVDDGSDDLTDYSNWNIISGETFSDQTNEGYNTNQSNTLFINCVFENNGSGLLVQKGNGMGSHNWINNVHFKNCIFRNNWKGHYNSDSHGAYIAQVDGLQFINCAFDTNGWNGLYPKKKYGRNHNLYLSHCSNVLVDSCVFRKELYTSLKFRAENPVCNNITVRNSAFIECGLPLAFDSNSSRPAATYYKNVNVYDNVFARTMGWPPEGEWIAGRGIKVSCVDMGLFENNWFGDDTLNYNEAIHVDSAYAMKSIVCKNNISELLENREHWTTEVGRKRKEHTEITWQNNISQDVANPSRTLENFSGNIYSAQDWISYYRA